MSYPAIYETLHHIFNDEVIKYLNTESSIREVIGKKNKLRDSSQTDIKILEEEDKGEDVKRDPRSLKVVNLSRAACYPLVIKSSIERNRRNPIRNPNPALV